jgi:hypothetical protein
MTIALKCFSTVADRVVVQDDLLLDDQEPQSRPYKMKPSAGAKGQTRRNTNGTLNPE